MDRKQRWRALARHYRTTIRHNTDLEAFARITEFAARQTDGDYDAFVLDLNRLVLAARTNRTAIVTGFIDRAKLIYLRRLGVRGVKAAANRFGSTGFAADDGSNQVQHFWYFVAVSHTWGACLAHLIARYHEWNAPGLLRHMPASGMGQGTAQDLALSSRAILLGRMLALHRIQPSEVANWIRRELAP